MTDTNRNLVAFLLAAFLLVTAMALTSHRDSLRSTLFPPSSVEHRVSEGKIRVFDGSSPTADSFLLNTPRFTPKKSAASSAKASKPLSPSLAKLAVEVSSRYRVSEDSAHEIIRVAHESAEEHQLPVTLILAVIGQESSFDARAVNNRDFGLMQVNSRWHADKVREAGGLHAMFNPTTNIKVGTRILNTYIQQAGGIKGGLRRYNGLDKRNNYPEEVLRKKSQFDSVFI